ncbi:hypothetical protein L7F22_035897 [Adiantum nelumboides]|nr:hypothetical protein [Adiantum nelumboides]
MFYLHCLNMLGCVFQVPFAANGCAYFQFHELCEMPLGAADYIGLFNKFHTLALEGIPCFGSHNRNAASRFVTLIDVFYEKRGRLLCSAEDEPFGLFKRCITVADAPKPRDSRAVRNDDADLCIDNELGFAKERTISRLSLSLSLSLSRLRINITFDLCTPITGKILLAVRTVN